MREVKPELPPGEAVPSPPGESMGRKAGATEDAAAVSSLSRSLGFREGTGDGRRAGMVGECVAGPWDRESTTDRSSSCFCWMAWSWLMTSSSVVPGGRPWDAIMDRVHGLLQHGEAHEGANGCVSRFSIKSCYKSTGEPELGEEGGREGEREKRKKRREEGRKREAKLRSSLGDTSPYVLVSAPAAAGRYHLGSLRAKTFTMRLESIEPSSQRCSCQYCTARRSAH